VASAGHWKFPIHKEKRILFDIANLIGEAIEHRVNPDKITPAHRGIRPCKSKLL